MFTDRYAKPGSTTIWEDNRIDGETKTQRNIIEGRTWPAGEIDIVHDRYIQFGVKATKGGVFNVDSIGSIRRRIWKQWDTIQSILL